MRNIQDILVVAARLREWREAKKDWKRQEAIANARGDFWYVYDHLSTIERAIEHDKKELATLLLDK